MANLSGSSVSYNSGKFKLAGTYEYTDGAIVFTAKCDVTDKFKSSHYITLEWSTDNSTWNSAKTSAKKNGDYTFAKRSVTGKKLYVRIKVGSSSYSKDTITIASTTPPSTIEAKIENDNCARIKVTGKSNSNRPTQTITIERSSNGYSGWSSITDDPIPVTISADAYTLEQIDEGIDAGNRYYYRAKAYNSSSGDSSYITCGPVYTSASSDAVSNVATSQSGNNITVTWNCTNESIQNGTVSKFYIKRSTNGGTYQTVGTVNAVVGQTSYSYVDTVSSGNSYQYMVSVSNESGGESSGGTTGGSEIETAPGSPLSVSVYRDGSDNVVINITGESSNADNVVIERSIDGGSWTQIANESYPLTTYTDTTATASDSIVYRVKYTNGTGSSGWTTSTAVQIKQKPSQPVLKSPVSGTPLDMAPGTARMVWQHRPLDGSPQTAAQLQYKVNSGSYQTVTLSTATYYDLSLSGLSANDEITWRVRTKGSHADYSDYSDESTFKLMTKPTLLFTEPENADVIETLPVIMQFSYNDACGTLKELKVEIIKKNNIEKTIYVDVGAGTSGTYTHSLAGFLFDNNTVYGLKAYALSSSGLSDETSISIKIEYAEVSIDGGLLPVIESDPETGYAYITVKRDITPGSGGVVPTPVEIAEAYLYREHDGENMLVDEVYEDMQVIDKYAPINVDYIYRLLLLTEDGEISIVSVTVRNNTPYWFIYWDGNIAKAKWNPDYSTDISRPQKTRVRYSGRRYPVSYDQDAIDEAADFSATIDNREDLNLFKKMIRDGGQGIWKSADGDVYDADFEFKNTPNCTQEKIEWKCSLSVTRIDGGE